MALADDVQKEIEELIDSAAEIKALAEAYIREPADSAQIEESDRERARDVVLRMDQLLKELNGIDLARASVEKVSALLNNAELGLDQADELMDQCPLLNA